MCSTNTAFSNAEGHSTLAQTRYTRQAMQAYLARWEQTIPQLISMDGPIDEILLFTMFVESFGERSSLPFETALSLHC